MEAERLIDAAQRGGRKERALNLIASKPMSRWELKGKLAAWGAGEDEQENVCNRFEELGLLNDAHYAELVVQHYSGKGYGERKLRDELYRRGIPRDLWEEALSQAREPGEAIDAFLAKKFKGVLPEDSKDLKKVSEALIRRGYTWNDVTEALRRLGVPEEN